MANWYSEDYERRPYQTADSFRLWIWLHRILNGNYSCQCSFILRCAISGCAIRFKAYKSSEPSKASGNRDFADGTTKILPFIPPRINRIGDWVMVSYSS